MRTLDIDLVARLQTLLDSLVSASRQTSNPYMNVAADVQREIRSLSPESVLQCLTKAIGSSKRRRAEAAVILGSIADETAAVDYTAKLLRIADADIRSSFIQLMGLHQLASLAPVLNERMESDSDKFCRGMAVHASGKLRQPVNLATLLKLAESADLNSLFYLSQAIAEFADSSCLPFLKKWHAALPWLSSERVFCAWGMVRCGDIDGLPTLVEMVDVGKVTGETASFRAAQAICDLCGWPFHGDRKDIMTTWRRIQSEGIPAQLKINRPQ